MFSCNVKHVDKNKINDVKQDKSDIKIKRKKNC